MLDFAEDISSAKAQVELGYEPRHLRVIVEETLAWMKQESLL